MRTGETPQDAPNLRWEHTIMHAPSPTPTGPPGRAVPARGPATAPSLLRRLWWVVPVLALLGALAAWVVVDGRPPEYQARASLLVGDTLGDYDHIRAAEALTATYAELASTRAILDEAAEGLTGDVDDLVYEVSTVPVGNSRVLLVTATARTPMAATHMADGVADALVQFRAPPRRQISLIDDAGPAEQVPDRRTALVAIATTGGGLGAAAILLALEPWVQGRRRGRRGG